MSSENTRLAQIRKWIAKLRSGGWIRLPTQHRCEVLGLLRDWTDEPELREAPEVEELLHTLGSLGVSIGPTTWAQLLTTIDGSRYRFEYLRVVPLTPEVATRLLEYFPTSGFQDEDAAYLLLPLAMMDTQDPNRLEVMRTVLQKRCDPNGKMWVEEFRPLSKWQEGTALHVAAERGDGEMVDLLLAYGARPDLQGHEQRTPAELAREGGHTGVGERIEARMVVVERNVRKLASEINWFADAETVGSGSGGVGAGAEGVAEALARQTQGAAGELGRKTSRRCAVM